MTDDYFKLNPEQRLGDQPVEEQYKREMKLLASVIDKFLNGDRKPKRNGFCLMVFPFENFDGRANYMSNADRADVIKLLEEQLKRFKSQPIPKGATNDGRS